MTSQVELDLTEVEVLLAQATRPAVQQALESLKKQLLVKCEAKRNKEVKTTIPMLRSTTKLTTYAFDESANFIKLYYSLPKIQDLPADQVKATFSTDSFDITVSDFNGRDYSISVKGFVHPIVAEKSVVKQKNDNLLVMLKKATIDTWGELLKIVQQKKQERERMDAVDQTNDDPQASLMKMMKKMYDEGDDEMKRNLRKTWYESQNKNRQGPGGMPNMLGLDD